VGLPVRAERRAEIERLQFASADSAGAAARNRPHVWSIVATDTARHVSDAVELLPYGDVLVEKPLAPTARDIDALAAAVRADQRKVYAAFCLRFSPLLQHLKSTLPSTGRVHSVRIEAQSYLPDWRPARDYRLTYSARRSEGGVLRDLSHELDYAVWLFGRPAQIFCTTENSGLLEIESEEAANLFWVVPGGPAVSLRLDYVTRVERRRMTIDGDFGSLECDLKAGTLIHRTAGGGETVQSFSTDRPAMLAAQLRAFVLGACAEHLATLDEGTFVAALTDAAYRSAAEKRSVTIEGAGR
jgi:predicted dehydrogenase